MGGAGDDQLVGAGAAPGDDGSKDRLTCGPGFDTAIVGSNDKYDQSCEDIILERGKTPNPDWDLCNMTRDGAHSCTRARKGQGHP